MRKIYHIFSAYASVYQANTKHGVLGTFPTACFGDVPHGATLSDPKPFINKAFVGPLFVYVFFIDPLSFCIIAC